MEFEWTVAQEQAFRDLKDCLVNPPVLAYPNFGPEAGEFILDTVIQMQVPVKGLGRCYLRSKVMVQSESLHMVVVRLGCLSATAVLQEQKC